MDDEQAIARIEQRLTELFRAARHRPHIVLCIGTDRSTGDSLGPMIGTKLQHLHVPRLIIMGTLNEPVHAANLQEHLKIIDTHYRNPFVIAVDACLGRLDSVGCITLADGPLRPGAGVNKELPPVGEAHITGIVNVGGFMEYMVLQNTRLNIVWNMSDKISQILARAYINSLA